MRSTGPLLCLASATAFGAMGIFGKLAYGEGASVGTLLATRFVLAAALFWGDPGVHRWPSWSPRAVPARRRHRARARRDRLLRPDGRLLRGARAHRRVAARPSRLHLPRDRHGRGDRARPRDPEPPHGRLAAARVGRSRARPGGRRFGRRGRPRSGSRARCRGRLQRLHPELGGHRGAPRPARAQHAGVHRGGDHAHVGRARGRRPRAGVASRRRGGRGSRASPSSPRSARSRCSSRASGASAPRPPRSSRRSSPWSRSRWRSSSSASPSERRSSSAGRSSSRPCSRCGHRSACACPSLLRDPWREATRSRGRVRRAPTRTRPRDPPTGRSACPSARRTAPASGRWSTGSPFPPAA